MLPPDLLALRALDQAFDGRIAPDLLQIAHYPSPAAYTRALARAAERNFHARILDTLGLIAAWRMRCHPYRWHRVRSHSEKLGLYRQKACEAFDLLL